MRTRRARSTSFARAPLAQHRNVHEAVAPGAASSTSEPPSERAVCRSTITCQASPRKSSRPSTWHDDPQWPRREPGPQRAHAVGLAGPSSRLSPVGRSRPRATDSPALRGVEEPGVCFSGRASTHLDFERVGGGRGGPRPAVRHALEDRAARPSARAKRAVPVGDHRERDPRRAPAIAAYRPRGPSPPATTSRSGAVPEHRVARSRRVGRRQSPRPGPGRGEGVRVRRGAEGPVGDEGEPHGLSRPAHNLDAGGTSSVPETRSSPARAPRCAHGCAAGPAGRAIARMDLRYLPRGPGPPRASRSRRGCASTPRLRRARRAVAGARRRRRRCSTPAPRPLGARPPASVRGLHAQHRGQARRPAQARPVLDGLPAAHRDAHAAELPLGARVVLVRRRARLARLLPAAPLYAAAAAMARRGVYLGVHYPSRHRRRRGSSARV